MGTIFKEEKRLTLAEQVANQIREAIKTGKLRAGDRLVEADLAKDMNIGRNAVREAMRYIEKEGLLVATPFKGAQVTGLNQSALKDLYDVRSALELLALDTLAQKINAEKMAVLHSAVKKMKTVAHRKKIQEIIDADLNFHRTICELSENKVLLEAWLNLSNRLRAFIASGQDLYGEDTPDVTLGTHYPVYEAIKAGDFIGARDQLKQILERGYQLASKYNPRSIAPIMDASMKPMKERRR